MVGFVLVIQICIFLFDGSTAGDVALTAGPVVAAALARAVDVDVAPGGRGAGRAARLGGRDVVEEGDDRARVVGLVEGDALGGGGRLQRRRRRRRL